MKHALLCQCLSNAAAQHRASKPDARYLQQQRAWRLWDTHGSGGGKRATISAGTGTCTKTGCSGRKGIHSRPVYRQLERTRLHSFGASVAQAE